MRKLRVKAANAGYSQAACEPAPPLLLCEPTGGEASVHDPAPPLATSGNI